MPLLPSFCSQVGLRVSKQFKYKPKAAPGPPSFLTVTGTVTKMDSSKEKKDFVVWDGEDIKEPRQ